MNIEIIHREALASTEKLFRGFLDNRQPFTAEPFNWLADDFLYDGPKPSRFKDYYETPRGIDEMLHNFCEVVKQGETPPPQALRFAARYLERRKRPEPKLKNIHLVVLVRLARDAHPHCIASDIASAMEIDDKTYRSYLRRSRASNNEGFDARYLCGELRRVVPPEILADLVHTLNYIAVAKEIPV